MGIDGFRGGWIAAHDERGPIELDAFVHMEDVWGRFHEADVIAIDIPIGLVCAPRTCDVEARKVLNDGGNRRGSSVFPAPCRCLFDAVDYADACDRTMACQCKKVSMQAWNIVLKIKDVDDHLVWFPRLKDVAKEVHPELTFAEILGAPATFRKSTAAGAKERFDGLHRVLRTLPIAGPVGWTHPSRGHAKADDVLDALAAFWTARRIASGARRRIPAARQVDSRGLRMEMWI